MTEFSDLSRLPDDEDYWKRLEERVVTGLHAPASGRFQATPEWWAPLARRAYALGALAAAAAIATLLLLPASSDAPAPSPTGILRPPEDPAMLAVLSAPEPPALTTLMLPPARSEPNE